MRSIAVLAALAALAVSFPPRVAAHGQEDILGTVSFPVLCTPEAQARFNKAAALLYSFHWSRVEAALNDVLAADPDCAMVYWAKAVASFDNPLGSRPTPKLEKQGWAAVERARQLTPKTERERDYIEAVEAFFKDHDKVGYEARAAAYERAMERLHARYPDDTEAAVLYAFWLQVTADRNDQTYSKQLRSAAILEKVFAARPHHPGAAHFLIHAYDFPAIASRGLDAAKRYAAIAPAAPHALHMPSHIFSRAGYWRDSIETNARSRAVSKLDVEVYHALDYMMYAELQLARDAEAQKLLDFIASAPKPKQQARQVAYASAAMPARFSLERGDWAAAAGLELHPARGDFAWPNFPEAEAVNAFARGIGAARSGNPEAARKELARLAKLREAMVAQKKGYWADQLDVQVAAVSAWIARAEGRNEDALKDLRAAADHEDRTEKHIMMPGWVLPVREMLGELLIDLDQPALALAAFEQSQKTDPNRFRNLYGAARAAELAGDGNKARQYYARLVEQCEGAIDRTELRQAKLYLARR
jgi:tetratricopeptide (TPR) repeat protein